MSTKRIQPTSANAERQQMSIRHRVPLEDRITEPRKATLDQKTEVEEERPSLLSRIGQQYLSLSHAKKRSKTTDEGESRMTKRLRGSTQSCLPAISLASRLSEGFDISPNDSATFETSPKTHSREGERKAMADLNDRIVRKEKMLMNLRRDIQEGTSSRTSINDVHHQNSLEETTRETMSTSLMKETSTDHPQFLGRDFERNAKVVNHGSPTISDESWISTQASYEPESLSINGLQIPEKRGECFALHSSSLNFPLTNGRDSLSAKQSTLTKCSLQSTPGQSITNSNHRSETRWLSRSWVKPELRRGSSHTQTGFQLGLERSQQCSSSSIIDEKSSTSTPTTSSLCSDPCLPSLTARSFLPIKLSESVLHDLGRSVSPTSKLSTISNALTSQQMVQSIEPPLPALQRQCLGRSSHQSNLLPGCPIRATTGTTGNALGLIASASIDTSARSVSRAGHTYLDAECPKTAERAQAEKEVDWLFASSIGLNETKEQRCVSVFCFYSIIIIICK